MESTVMGVFYSEDAIESEEEYNGYGSKVMKLKNGEVIYISAIHGQESIGYKGRLY